MTKQTDPKQPREFSSMDDHDNDGWNNSTIEREDGERQRNKLNEIDDEDWGEEEDFDGGDYGERFD